MESQTQQPGLRVCPTLDKRRPVLDVHELFCLAAIAPFLQNENAAHLLDHKEPVRLARGLAHPNRPIKRHGCENWPKVDLWQRLRLRLGRRMKEKKEPQQR